MDAKHLGFANPVAQRLFEHFSPRMGDVFALSFIRTGARRLGKSPEELTDADEAAIGALMSGALVGEPGPRPGT